MPATYEFLIWDQSGIERRVRVVASSEDKAWSLISLAENESASITKIANRTPEDTVLHNDDSTEDMANDSSAHAKQTQTTPPSLKYPIGFFESLIYLYSPGSISSEEQVYLLAESTRPHLLIAGSSTARILLAVLVWAVTLTQVMLCIGVVDNGNIEAWQAILFYPVLSVSVWLFLIAIFRYAFIIFPWERRNNTL